MNGMILALLLAPGTPAATPPPCSKLCTCGCNQGKPCRCNGPPTQDSAPQEKNFGVDVDRISKEKRYRVNGAEASRDKVIGLIEDQARIRDTSGHLRVTVIGTEADRQQVLGDLRASPALAAWRDKAVAQGYGPDHWVVRSYGLFTGGSPTIYVQGPDGEVLHRQDDYADGPEGLARALKRTRRDYDRAKDRDLRKVFLGGGVPWPVWVLGAVTAGVLLWRRKR